MRSLMRISTVGIKAVLMISFSTFFIFSASAQNTDISQLTDHSQGAVLVSWKFLERWVNARSGTKVEDGKPSTLIDEKMQQINFTVSDIPVHVPSAHLQASGSFAPVQVRDNRTFWSTKNLDIQLDLDGFSVEKEFVKDIDGITIIVTLKADCGPLTLRQTAGNFASTLAWQARHKDFQLSVEDLQLSWPLASWQVSSVSCQGPEGFGEFVQKEISEALKNPQQIEQWLKPLMQDKLNAKIAETLLPLTKPTWLDQNQIFSTQTNATQVINNRGLVLFVGIETNVNYQNPTVAIKQSSVQLRESSWEQAQAQPILIMPKHFFENTARHARIFPRVDNLLNNIEGFRKILNSRFLQTLFWPELKHFKKDSPFTAVSLVQGQTYAVPENAPQARFIGGHRLSIRAAISTWVRAVRDGQGVDWAYIDTKIQGIMQYSLNKGEMIFQMQEAQLSLSVQHMPEYKKKYLQKDSHKFPQSRIRDAMQSQIAGGQFRLKLPTLSLEGAGIKDALRVQAVSELNNDLVFTFAPIELNP